MPDDLQYPQDTFVGGAAQQSKTDPDGNNFIYDNATNEWVFVGKRDWQAHPNVAESTRALAQGLRRLESPETPKSDAAVEPPPPSPMEQVAAVKALNDQMRQEEASLIGPPPTRTGTMPVAQPISAPITPPQGGGVNAPLTPPSPDRLATLQNQMRPGVRTPPSAGAAQFYNLQAYQRAIQMGMDKKLAAGIYLPGILQQPQTKPVHVGPGGTLVNPMTGETVFTAPQRPISPEAQSLIDHRQRLAKEAEAKAAKALPPRDPILFDEMSDLRKRIASTEASIAKGEMDEKDGQKLISGYQWKLDALKAKYYGAVKTSGQPGREFGRGIGVLKPEGTSPAAPSETPKVTTQAQFDALPSGTIYIGTDGKKKRKP